MTIAALVVAAGRGTRAGGVRPKQFQRVGGVPMLARSTLALARHADIDRTIVVLHPDDMDLFEAEIAPFLTRYLVETVIGGDDRCASARNGLEALDGKGVSHVLIHDAARPFLSADLISQLVAGLNDHDGAAPGVPVTDALWRGVSGKATGAADRSNLFRAQTPQAFVFDKILAAHRNSATGAADDVEIALNAHMDVTIVQGVEQNFKITTAADFDRAEQLLDQQMTTRTGTGFDVHAFEDGDHVMLCGVKIAHDRGLRGHSDADVAMHAITDAIFGAMAEGDIGQWFPPSDPKWAGVASQVFLAKAVERMAARCMALANIDCTVICQHPKIGPHSAKMRAEIARIVGVDADRISVKATTSEGLGFTGRNEGIAAMATATLVAL